jgi:transcriptional regulator with XRE-family HTH domain
MLLLLLPCELSCAMPDTFGARLRERREQQQISLSTIAEQTKIKLSLLEALERGDVSHWPSGIFRRAFIRAYAHAIGLEPDIVVREFLELYPDPAEIVEPVPAIAAVIDGPSGGPPTRLRYLVASAVGSLSRRRARTPGEPIANSEASRAIDPSTRAAAVLRQPPPAADVAAAPPESSTRLDHASPVAQPPDFAEVAPAPAHAAAAEEAEQLPSQVAPAPAAGAPASMFEPSSEPVDLPAIAELCTQLGRVSSIAGLKPLLQEAARILDASGLVVWIWDPLSAELHPSLAYGYSDRVLAQIPGLPRDANNATAAAFREAQMCVVRADDATNGALVLPLMTPSGCVGVLALELLKRNEEREAVRAAGTIIAAQLAALIGAAAPAETAEPVRSAR